MYEYAVVYRMEPEGKRYYKFIKAVNITKVIEAALGMLPTVNEILSIIRVI